MADNLEDRIKKLKQRLTLISTSLGNAVNQLKSGKVVSAATITELQIEKERLNTQITRMEAGEENITPPTPSYVKRGTEGALRGAEGALEDEYGIPERLRIKRPYTMSGAALQQRKDAANSSEKAKGMLGNRNAWKTGEHAKGFIRQVFRPCKSTCAQYPCSLVSDGETEPGEICLDKIEVARTINAIEKAMSGDMTDFNALTAVRLAGSLDILRMLQEDIAVFNTHLKSEKLDKEGNVIGVEIKSHPSLIPLIKLTEVLKITPADLMISPKELAKKEINDEENNTLAGLMSLASRALSGKRLKVPGEDTDE